MAATAVETVSSTEVGASAWPRRVLSSGRFGHRTARRTAAEADEAAVVWIGRVVVTASLLMGAAQVGGWRVGSLTLMMLVLYLGYAVVYWPAVQTHRVEAGTEVLIAAAQTAIYTAALAPLW